MNANPLHFLVNLVTYFIFQKRNYQQMKVKANPGLFIQRTSLKNRLPVPIKLTLVLIPEPTAQSATTFREAWARVLISALLYLQPQSRTQTSEYVVRDCFSRVMPSTQPAIGHTLCTRLFTPGKRKALAKSIIKKFILSWVDLILISKRRCTVETRKIQKPEKWLM